MSVLLAVAFLVLFGALVGLSSWVYVSGIEHSLTRDAEILLDMVASSVSAAMIFEEQDAAMDFLAQVGVNRDEVKGVRLVDAGGEVFARYVAVGEDEATIFGLPGENVLSLGDSRQVVSRKVMLDGEYLGEIQMVSGLDGIRSSLWEKRGMLTGLVAVVWLLAVLITRRVIGVLMKPVNHLVETTGRIAREHDYTLRARLGRDDEVGHLTVAINGMLDQIQHRDEALATKIVELDWEKEELYRTRESEGVLREKLERARRMEALGILAGGVAHDLNNLLGPMVGYPDLILETLPMDSPAREDVERIKACAARMAAVIKDLLALGRRGHYEMVPVSLTGEVNTFLQGLTYEDLMRTYPKIHADIDLTEEDIFVEGSKSHLLQVVMNLFRNACEAMDKKGGELILRTDRVDLLEEKRGFESIPAGTYATLTVGDQGVGIARGEVEYVFEPFYTKKVQGKSGSGLGLAVVYGVIKDHDGYIDVESELGKGTQFTLYFPVTQSVPAAVVPEGDHMGEGRDRLILLVDDNADQRRLLTRILTGMDYEVVEAQNGHEALDLLPSIQPDLVLLDMIMEPNFDGLDTFLGIRRTQPDLGCIIVSGYSENDRVEEAMRQGALGFISKPFSRQFLAEMVATHLPDRKQQPD